MEERCPDSEGRMIRYGQEGFLKMLEEEEESS